MLTPTRIYVSEDEPGPVKQAVELFRSDLAACTRIIPEITVSIATVEAPLLITRTKSDAPIRHLRHTYSIGDHSVEFQWEKYLIQLICAQDAKSSILLLLRSDRVGVGYGLFELSPQLGASSSYWWADAPVAKHSKLNISVATRVTHAPKLEYRRIFIGDEDSALSGWATENFDGFNSGFTKRFLSWSFDSKK